MKIIKFNIVGFLIYEKTFSKVIYNIEIKHWIDTDINKQKQN